MTPELLESSLMTDYEPLRKTFVNSSAVEKR